MTTIQGAPRIEARDVDVTFGNARVVAGASFIVRPGEIATIEGPSGSGKTTLLRVVASLGELTAGSIFVDGVDAMTIAPRDYRKQVAYVAQDAPMLDGTACENVLLGARLRGETPPRANAIALMDRVGLGGSLASRSARDLSGGEKQRVALARALANDPRALLLDEPTSALDEASVSRIADLVRSLAQSGLAIVVVTHSASFADAIATTRYRMDRGYFTPLRDAS